MSILSGIKSTYKKSEAAVVVQNLLEDKKRIGLLYSEPAKLATKLVGLAWAAKPDVFDGKFGERPHKITVAACALATGVELFDDADFDRNAIILSLGDILSEVETNGRLYPLNNVDHALLEFAMSIFSKIGEEILGSPFADKTGLG